MTTTNGQSKDKKPMKNEKATANGNNNNKEPKKKNKNKTMNQGSKKSMNDTQNGNNNNKKKKQEQAKPKNAPERTSSVPTTTATATNKTPTTMNNNDNSNNNVVNKEQHAPPPPQRRNMTTRYISSKPFTLVTGRGPIPNIVLSSGGNMDDSHVDALTQWMDQSEKIKKLVINNKGESSSSSSGGGHGPLPLRCNIEMQENQFSDAGIEKLVNFLLNRTHLIQVNALKLWKNKIGDVGAQHLARLIRELPYALVELHLSHNRITTQGALSILKAIESSDLYPRCKSSKSSKLSTKKCQATDNSEESEESSIDDIVEENANSGTVVDDNTNDNQTQTVHIEEDPLNTSNDSDSTSSSSGNIDVTIESPPTKETNNSYVPLWLRLEFNFINLELLEKGYDYKSALCPCDASNRNLCGPNSCSLVHKSSQDNKKCKVHLYVFHLQYEKPEESTLLTDAKNTIQKIKQRSASSPSNGVEQVNEKEQISPEIAADEMFVSHLPTYIFIDTCAILNMIDGPKFVHPAEHRFCQNFNFKSLISKAMAHKFGTALENEGDKVHLIVTDTVMQELDHRKSKEKREWLREAIRRQIQSDQGYMEKCSRMKFMTCLGAHQGELLLKSSNTSFFSTPNVQGNLYNDLKLLEVAMFWSKELGFNKNVIVLTSDYEVKRRARSHNIPAELIKNIDKSLTSFTAKNPDAPWTASVIKACMREVYKELSQNPGTITSNPNSIFAELESAGALVKKLLLAIQDSNTTSADARQELIEEANNATERWKSLLEVSRNWINK